MKIYLIRHTKVKIDPTICYGQSNVQLAETFNDEFFRIKKILPEKKHKCFSSDLKRCSDLAKYLSDDVVLDKKLREINFGSWEGKSWLEIETLTKTISPENFAEFQYPDGESFIQQRKRVVEFLNCVLKKNVDDLLIVSHGGTIRIILAEILGLPLENSFRLKIDYGSVSEISIEKDFITVDKINMV